jgi:hypothetical protein
MDWELGGEWEREIGEKIRDLFGGGEGTVRLEPASAVPITPVLERHTKTMKMLLAFSPNRSDRCDHRSKRLGENSNRNVYNRHWQDGV